MLIKDPPGRLIASSLGCHLRPVGNSFHGGTIFCKFPEVVQFQSGLCSLEAAGPAQPGRAFKETDLEKNRGVGGGTVNITGSSTCCLTCLSLSLAA